VIGLKYERWGKKTIVDMVIFVLMDRMIIKKRIKKQKTTKD